MLFKKRTLEESLTFMIVDMQERFLRYIKEPQKELLINSQKELLTYCSEKNVPVIVLEYKESILGRSFIGEKEENYITIDEIKEQVKKVPRFKYIEKIQDDGFKGNEILKNQLSLLKTKYILFSGVNASSCVRDTAISAIKFGFKILTAGTLIEDNSCITRRGLEEKSKGWYMHHGIYFEDHLKLIDYIQEKSKK